MNKQLLLYAKSGKYVFHGSPAKDLEYLNPTQSKHVPNLKKPNQIILDGLPSVSASIDPEFACFRAIINKININLNFISGFGMKNGEKEFHVSSKEVLLKAKNKKGFVYVLDKKEFKPYSRNGKPNLLSMEWRSSKIVRPLKMIKVSFKDLPKENLINIFPNHD